MRVNVKRVARVVGATGVVDLMDVIDQYAREADAKDIECNVPKPGVARRHIGRPEWEFTSVPATPNALVRADTNTNTSGNIFVGITDMLRRSGQLGNS